MNNFSPALFSVFLAFTLIWVPRAFVVRAQFQAGFNNRTPRAQQATLTGLGQRAQGAHLNSFEAFAPFAAGILGCTLRGVSPHLVGTLGFAFIGVRVAYIALYLGDRSSLRSAVWSFGCLITFVLLGLAAIPY